MAALKKENYSIPYESTSTPHVSAIEIAKEAASLPLQLLVNPQIAAETLMLEQLEAEPPNARQIPSPRSSWPILLHW
ncbi:hypothetical protein FGK64_06895 [Arenibacterium halophilum]|uniref:Uncharacterized protein n=2 Tax=Arenibacterium halophilum TaxID=2583821 RepID=A0ABY2X830_9RHOB|nr:hypothetical protein FGK64_06895 [Arenibacterium halophilum]